MPPALVQQEVKVVSAAPARVQLSEEERRKRFAELRERMSASMIAVRNPEPGRAYYWARKDDDGELSRLDLLGFRITKSDPKTTKPIANGLREDGTYQLGDVMLTDIESDIYSFFQEENVRKAQNLVSAAKEEFVAEAEKHGVPTFQAAPKKGV